MPRIIVLGVADTGVDVGVAAGAAAGAGVGDVAGTTTTAGEPAEVSLAAPPPPPHPPSSSTLHVARVIRKFSMAVQLEIILKLLGSPS
ncbi:MAG: hypothetical protein EOO77_27540 [Oxalobacteraceae bacterium]|nr:MAG: hypothetical protein EOO77_27540 [Oxalobacteraceae bacterium]